MENKKQEKSESRWSEFVSSFEDHMSMNPFYEMDDFYMTTNEKQNMYREATDELKLKLKILKEKNKNKEQK